MLGATTSEAVRLAAAKPSGETTAIPRPAARNMAASLAPWPIDTTRAGLRDIT